MKETLNLTRILFKNSLNKNSQKYGSCKKKISMTILLILVAIYIIGVLGFFSYELINSLKLINQEKVFLSLCLVATVAVTLFKTILTSLNVLYFSKDVEFLLPLPLKPISIVLAKFNVMLISEYITELITFIVPFVVYGYIMKVGLSFYIYSLLVFLFLPIIPMLISAVIIVFIMKFTKFLNNKDIVQYLSVFLTIVIVIAVQFINTSSNEVTNFMIANKMMEINGLTSTFSEYFFTVKQATIAITSEDNFESIKNILFLGLESIGVYILVAFAVSKIYLESAVYATVSSVKRKKVKVNNFSNNSVGKSYIKKEIRILFRNPVFFLQCVLPSLLFPIIFFIPIYRTITLGGTEGMQLFKTVIYKVLEDSMGFGLVLCIINFLYMFNFISVTAISRDGENAIFMKYIPIELHKQCKYKVVPSIILNFIPLIYVIGIIKYFVPEVMWITIVEIGVISLMCNVLISYIAIFIDLLRPKLHWTSEYHVVKQNLNMLFDAILVFIIMGIIISICSYVENLHILTIILAILSMFTLAVYEVMLRKYSRQIFKKIA